MKLKSSKKAKIVKILKFFNFNSFFLYDGAKNRPPNLGFWTLTFTFFHIILATFQKNSCVQMKLESSKKAKNSENIEIF